MAYNVFGNAITDLTLNGLPEYEDKEIITRVDRARVALNMKNAADKDVNARSYVKNLKASSGTGDSTLCLIYNATGNSVTYVTAHNWAGLLGPAPYPGIIQNGQWGGYLHGKYDESAAAVVYRGKNDAGQDCDWMVSWFIPRQEFFRRNNAVYTEIREARYYDTVNWSNIYGRLNNSGPYHSADWEGCFSTVSTGSSDTSPIFEGILTLSQAL